MDFNEVWTKEKNDLLRQFIREKKSTDFILNYFGEDLKHHPKKKYSYSKIMPFEYFEKYGFINEIKITPEYTKYRAVRINSIFYNNKFDYELYFDLNNHDYVLLYLFYIVNGIDTYNVVMTTKQQYLDYKKELSNGNRNYDQLKNIIERETGYEEVLPLIKRISFIISDFCNRMKIFTLSIGETDNKVKIKLYRNIIKDSFKNIKESIEKDNFGNIYYIYVLN